MVAQTEAAANLLSFFQGAQLNINQRVDAAETAFEDLADDLIGLLRRYSNFRATLDPNEANPTNDEGGTFTSLDDIIAATPVGAFVDVTLPAGSDFHLSDLLQNGQHMSVVGRILRIRSAGGGGATLRVDNYVNDGTEIYSTRLNLQGSTVFLKELTLVLEPRVNNALPWNGSYGGPIRSIDNFTTLGAWITDCSIVGSDGASLIVVNGSNVNASVVASDLDGAFSLMSGLSSGVATLATRGLTMSNSADVTDGTETLGVNFLTNQI
jgi:hypothetical protein